MDITKSKIIFPLSRFVIIGVIIILPFFPFLSTWLGTSIGPLLLWKASKEILIFSLLIAMSILFIFANKRIRQLIFFDKLLLLIVLFGFISGASSYFAFQAGTDYIPILAGLLSGLRYMVFFALCFITAYVCGQKMKNTPRILIKYIVYVGLLLSILGIIQVYFVPKMFLAGFGYDALFTIPPFLTVDDNPDALRAFATLRGPNDYGAYLILPFLAVLTLIRRHNSRQYVFILIFILAGILLSASRSALAGLLISLGIFALMRYGKQVFTKLSKRQILATFTLLAVSFALFIYGSINYPPLRLAVFHSSPDDSSLFEGSTANHFKATYEGMQRMDDNALGCGMGCAGPASYYSDSPKISENYYVQIAEEVGLFGLLLWLLIFIIIMTRLYRVYRNKRSQLSLILLSSGFGISFIGMLLHVWSDDPLSLTWWGLAGIVLGLNYHKLTTQYNDKSHEKNN